MGSLPQLSVLAGARRARGSETTLHEQFQENLQLSQCGEKTALLFTDDESEVRLTYDELNSRANSIARLLAARARAAGPNSDGDYIIAVCMKPSHCTIVTLLATWKAGAVYVPMESSFPRGRIAHILTDCRPALVVYDETAKSSMFTPVGVPAISYEDLVRESERNSGENLKSEEQVAKADPQIAIVMYTSGSTGVPKGVRLSHAAVSNRIWWQYDRFPFAMDECACVWKTAITFVDSVCEMWAPLLRSRALVVLSKELIRDPQKLVEQLDKYQIQRLVLVPTLLRSILMYLGLDATQRPLRKLKLWVCSGETLTKDLAAQFFKYFGDEEYRLANFYGSTEVMGDVTYHVLQKMSDVEKFSSIPVGAPIDNCVVYLLDSEMSPVREGATAEMWVSGLNLASGYVGGQGSDKFRTNTHCRQPGFDRLFRTGDHAVMAEGVVLFAGRTDSQIKIRGHRVDLQEVEAAVSSVPGIDKCVVLCYGASTTTPTLLAFVTFTAGVRMTSKHVETALTDKLTNYMLPQVIDLDNIPLLVNGKVDRQALLKMYENTNNNDDSSIQIDTDYTGVSEKERAKAEVLFTTVGEVVGRSLRGTLSLQSNFYELGGNSLNSIYTITQLREKGYYIEISDFLGAANLGEILSKLGNSPTKGDEPEASFTLEFLQDYHKDVVIEMIIKSFYEKADLEQHIRDEIAPDDYKKCIEDSWSLILNGGVSFLLRDKRGAIVAVALNGDIAREHDRKIVLPEGLAKIMDFLEYIEGPVRENMLPKGEGVVMHACMMGTSAELSGRDNVAAIRTLELNTLRIAKERGFRGVFTTNTSPLTQQLGRDVLGFQTLVDYQVNQYVTPSGERPFAAALDSQRALVCWKPIE